jgi:hypothetical protein
VRNRRPPARRLQAAVGCGPSGSTTVFCSAELEPVACRYHHAWCEAGLSDHSALEADLGT